MPTATSDSLFHEHGAPGCEAAQGEQWPAGAACALSPPLPPPTLARPPRFCAACGAECQVDDACATCARRAAAATQMRQTERSQNRGIRTAITLYFTLLGLLACAYIAVATGAPWSTAELAWGILSSGIVLVFCALGHLPVMALLRPHWRWCVRAVVLSTLTFAAGVGLAAVINLLSGIDGLSPGEQGVVAEGGIALAIVTWCVQPALFEELAFRGVIFDALGRTLGPRETIAVSAFLFMTIHLNVAMFPLLLLLGVALGWLRWRTNSLVPGMVLHFSHNFLVLMLCVAMGD